MNQLRFEIDPAYEAGSRLILRYAPSLLTDGLADDVRFTSQQEGSCLLELGDYRGVRLFLLDETTKMKTGTYKSLDGCITTAHCKNLGFKQAVFSSGANTGIALTDYAGKIGLETFFFCPTTTLYKLNGKLFERPGAHLIAVEGPDARVKEAASKFASLCNFPLIPKMEWRLLSARFRSLFIAEAMRQMQHGFTWFAQAICAGFGPIGVFQTLRELANLAEIDVKWIPKFLGIQQAGLSPIVQAWENRHSVLPPPNVAGSNEPFIEPALYNANPAQTYPLLHEILNTTGGSMMAIRVAEFEKYLDAYLSLITAAGIRLTCVEMNGKIDYIEKAGLLAGTGILKAIADGLIRPGESVLCCLTGGAGPSPESPAQPEFMIPAGRSLTEELQTYAVSKCGFSLIN